jgi:hypothetical protein
MRRRRWVLVDLVLILVVVALAAFVLFAIVSAVRA